LGLIDSSVTRKFSSIPFSDYGKPNASVEPSTGREISRSKWRQTEIRFRNSSERFRSALSCRSREHHQKVWMRLPVLVGSIALCRAIRFPLQFRA